MNTKQTVTIFVVLALLIGGFYTLNSYIYVEKQGDDVGPVASSTDVTPTQPQRVTLTGKQVCLPHRDTTGPQTLECAIGMQTVAGDYYALDFNLMSQTPPANISNGETFTASGVITPTMALSSDHWQKYNMKGIFSVTDVSVVKSPTLPPAPKESATGACYVGGCSSEVCSGEKDVASNCMYREEFMCYKKTNAKCERQAETGKCGWTPTAALNTCLSASVSIN